MSILSCVIVSVTLVCPPVEVRHEYTYDFPITTQTPERSDYWNNVREFGKEYQDERVEYIRDNDGRTPYGDGVRFSRGNGFTGR